MRCWPPWRREKRGTPSLLDYYPARDFVVGDYLDRMIELAGSLTKKQERHELTLWWGDEGLRLRADGSIEQIKRPQPASSLMSRPIVQAYWQSCCAEEHWAQCLGRDPTQSLQAELDQLRLERAMMAQTAAIQAPIAALYAQIDASIRRQNNMIWGGDQQCPK